jgi:uncharacterized membrane protein YhhN
VTSAQRWIAFLLAAVLLFAAVAEQGHSSHLWAVLTLVLFVLGLGLLREAIPRFELAAPVAPSRLARSARAPPSL